MLNETFSVIFKHRAVEEMQFLRNSLVSYQDFVFPLLVNYLALASSSLTKMAKSDKLKALKTLFFCLNREINYC